MKDSTKVKLHKVFKDVLGVEVKLTETTTANDIEQWDSMNNIRLIYAVESEFSIKINAIEVISLENVGALANLIESKLESKAA